MKPLILLLTTLLFFGSEKIFALTTYDSDGFPNCTVMQDKTFFFDWDQISKAQNKKVFYFELNSYVTATGHSLHGCLDTSFLHEIPSEIKIELEFDKNIFSKEIRAALMQVSQGAHKYYPQISAKDFIAAHPEFFQVDSPDRITQLRYELGVKAAADIVKTWTEDLFSSVKDCGHLIGSCDFYLCQELKNPCGLDGYNIGYGFKYCSGSKYSLLPSMSSGLGQRWVPDVFTCLQEKNFLATKEIAGNQCRAIQLRSLNSHASCYADAGFCKLKISDKAKIFNLIKSQILSSSTLSQTSELLKRCEGPL